VQTPNSDKNWQTSCPLQTFVCNISRHLEFIIEQGHRVNSVSGSLDSQVTGSLGHKMWPSSMYGVQCLYLKEQQTGVILIGYYYFASAADALDSSHVTASSSALWSRFSPASNFANGLVSTMWFTVCRWPQSQDGDWARPHLCKLARHGPWPVRKRLIRDHVWRETAKPGCRIAGSVTTVAIYKRQQYWPMEG